MDKNRHQNILLKYAGLGMQLLIAIGLAVFAGMKFDQWLGILTPVFVWALPLLIIGAIIFKIIKDTSPRK